MPFLLVCWLAAGCLSGHPYSDPGMKTQGSNRGFGGKIYESHYAPTQAQLKSPFWAPGTNLGDDRLHPAFGGHGGAKSSGHH